jgi:hypothetical protein
MRMLRQQCLDGACLAYARAVVNYCQVSGMSEADDLTHQLLNVAPNWSRNPLQPYPVDNANTV